MEFVISIRSVFFHDLFEDGLQYFIRGFSQTIHLRVVRCAFLMYYRIMCGEFSTKAIEKMTAFVADELYWTSKTTPEVFVNEFGGGHGCVIAKCLGLYPF